MKYSTIDRSVYGIKIRSTPQASIGGEASEKKTGDKASDDDSHNCSSAQPSSASSTPLHSASNTGQSITQFVERTHNGGVSHELPSPLTTTATLSSTVAPHPPTSERASIHQQEKIKTRKERLAESRKRRRRENVARKVGHDVDSDEEREYWRAVFNRHAAEEARRQALSPEARRQEDIQRSAEVLRNHIKPQLTLDSSGSGRLRYYPLFLFQEAPDSRNGATCRLDHCTDRITPGQYRIALSPGIWDSRGPDFYHVKCFEQLLDLSSPHYAARFEPDMRKHIPDHGAQCILEEYISRWKLRTQQTPKHEEDPRSSPSAEHITAVSSSTQINSATANENANPTEQQVPSPKAHTGSAAPEQIPVASDENPMQTPSACETAAQSPSASEQTVEPDVWHMADVLWAQVRQAEAEASREHNRICDLLLHIDNPDDVANPLPDQDRTWHITQYLLPDDDPDYDERHALSQALEDWSLDIMLANEDMSKLTEAGRAAKEALGERTVKRIKRYQCVRMPDYQSLFFGRR
ncbi:uncharacterized protein A1O5_12867 [Cladophialophora psammophila CBS 110553]|uniref:PARP-type domain-containing protein n=1 Tax=Cladophialophora psammophila CBS 110553 TaxID=1182543 RepID=W9VS23_9EURO|nr:uncharacterized protein A1O5_12867 [Cladophialophora psammophila CBS 110553]EXJ54956.1 hypothetical protein A1O5_12867 [Cladophialophora psammophila CBS 110553]